MSNRKKVIITGGSGLFATNIAITKRDDWDIYLFVRTMNVALEGVSIIQVDLEDTEAISKAVFLIRPDLIIHAAAMTDVDLCDQYIYKAYIGNVLIARNMAQVANKLDIKLVHISSDHFSKDNQFSKEDEIALPVNVYAKTKLEAEFEVMRHAPNSIIARTNFFGWGHGHRRSFSDFIINSLREKKEVGLFTDVFITPIFIDDLVFSLEKLNELNFS